MPMKPAGQIAILYFAMQAACQIGNASKQEEGQQFINTRLFFFFRLVFLRGNATSSEEVREVFFIFFFV